MAIQGDPGFWRYGSLKLGTLGFSVLQFNQKLYSLILGQLWPADITTNSIQHSKSQLLGPNTFLGYWKTTLNHVMNFTSQLVKCPGHHINPSSVSSSALGSSLPNALYNLHAIDTTVPNTSQYPIGFVSRFPSSAALFSRATKKSTKTSDSCYW